MLSDRQHGWQQDILDNVGAIKRHLDHLAAPDFDSFQSDELVVDAVERCFSRISEAAVKLGDKAEAEIWNDIRGLGNPSTRTPSISASSGKSSSMIWDRWRKRAEMH